MYNSSIEHKITKPGCDHHSQESDSEQQNVTNPFALFNNEKVVELEQEFLDIEEIEMLENMICKSKKPSEKPSDS